MSERGLVASFDDHAGTGTVSTEDGREFFFHCTAIEDGSRSIKPGTPVEFDIVAGHMGRWEAGQITPS